jgi:hypothetical protein
MIGNSKTKKIKNFWLNKKEEKQKDKQIQQIADDITKYLRRNRKRK